jgi:hypothetical protein
MMVDIVVMLNIGKYTYVNILVIHNIMFIYEYHTYLIIYLFYLLYIICGPGPFLLLAVIVFFVLSSWWERSCRP